MSTNMIRKLPAPMERAASTYSFSFWDSVWPRTILPIAAQEKKAITPMVRGRLALKTAARTIASST